MGGMHAGGVSELHNDKLLHTLRVEWVSPTSAGVTVQMIQVLAFPPRDDCNILVNLDSLNGMWALYNVM